MKIVRFLQTTVFYRLDWQKSTDKQMFRRDTRFSLSLEMSRLAQNGTTKPVSRDQILRREHGQGNIHLPVQLTTNRIGNLTRLIHTLAICVTIHTYIHLIENIDL